MDSWVKSELNIPSSRIVTPLFRVEQLTKHGCGLRPGIWNSGILVHFPTYLKWVMSKSFVFIYLYLLILSAYTALPLEGWGELLLSLLFSLGHFSLMMFFPKGTLWFSTRLSWDLANIDRLLHCHFFFAVCSKCSWLIPTYVHLLMACIKCHTEI